jgi:ribosomal protein L9
MKTVAFVLGAFLIGALAGYAPMYLQLRDARAQAEMTAQQLTTERDAARKQLAMSSLHNQMGILLTEIRSADFAAARETSTKLYDSVNQAIPSAENADDERRLRTIAETRDQVTAALALNDPAIEQTVWRLFALLSASLP